MKNTGDIKTAAILVFSGVFGYVMYSLSRKQEIVKSVSASNVTFDPKFKD